jgi:hypothetical protein
MANEKVVFQTCDFFKQTLQDKVSENPIIRKKFDEFVAYKAANPMANYGGSDEPYISKGPLGKAISGLKHAHLTRDLSVMYTLSGNNPRVIKLYGIVSHKDSGTGTPANINKQQSLGKRLVNQSFS